MRPLAPNLQALIDGEMRPNERVVWTGSPKPSRMFRKSVGLAIFGLIWSALPTGMIVASSYSKNKVPIPVYLFLSIFLVIGALMILAPFWAPRRAAKTAYAITNQRAIIIEPGFFGKISIRSFLPQNLVDIRRVQFADGSGDLILDRRVSVDSEGRRSTSDIGFFGVEQVHQVESLLLALPGVATRSPFPA